MGVFEKIDEFFAVRLGGPSRALLLVAALALVPTYLAPLWNLTMFAPQYQEGLRLDIYSYKLEGGNKGQDVKEINVLNHYIGMRDLAAEDFTEFKWMPFVIGALALVMVRAAVFGKMANLVDVLAIFGYFGAFSLWSFAYKLYRYGHDLAPTAAVKVPPFMPPVFGRAQLANFEVYSYPAFASYAILASAVALLAAGAVAYRAFRRA
jgi:hypothetical protein